MPGELQKQIPLLRRRFSRGEGPGNGPCAAELPALQAGAGGAQAQGNGPALIMDVPNGPGRAWSGGAAVRGSFDTLIHRVSLLLPLPSPLPLLFVVGTQYECPAQGRTFAWRRGSMAGTGPRNGPSTGRAPRLAGSSWPASSSKPQAASCSYHHGVAVMARRTTRSTNLPKLCAPRSYSVRVPCKPTTGDLEAPWRRLPSLDASAWLC
jgi:hypothetical protein